MKSQFPEYYRITHTDLLAKFEELVFVFDASALLDIFRLDKTHTDEIFEVLSRYSSQITVPYHAAEEYNNRIHSVLQEQLHNIDNAQSAFDAFTKLLEAKRNQPYISSGSTKKLKILKNSIQRDFQAQRQYLLDQLLHGELQNKMSEILDGRVLTPFTEEDLIQICEEGEKRYIQKIPPGWKDNTKGENAYGDLINWKEILRFAKEQQKSIVFITNDQKEDWICKYDGKTICPHYELLREFYQTVCNKQLMFHIYTLDRFLGFVREQDQDSVSAGTVEQVRDLLGEASLITANNYMQKLQETLAKINATSFDYGHYADLITRLSPSTFMLKDVVPSLNSTIETTTATEEIREKSDNCQKEDLVGDDSREESSSSGEE